MYLRLAVALFFIPRHSRRFVPCLDCNTLITTSLPFFLPPQVVDLNLAHRALKGRTAAVAAVLRAYDELVALGGAWKGTLYCTAVLVGVAHDVSRFARMIATVREKRIT